MVVQCQERSMRQPKVLSKLIETEKPGFSVKVKQTALVRTCEAK